ncbi:hypothetical protein STZ1_10528 [Bacillus subtilis]
MKKMTTALLVIDIQNDYFPNGKMALTNPEKAAQNAAKLLSHFRNTGAPVFHASISQKVTWLIFSIQIQKVSKFMSQYVH